MNVEYQIVDIDYWENDAVLVIGENRYYFQFSPEQRDAGLTIITALDNMKNEIIAKN